MKSCEVFESRLQRQQTPLCQLVATFRSQTDIRSGMMACEIPVCATNAHPRYFEHKGTKKIWIMQIFCAKYFGNLQFLCIFPFFGLIEMLKLRHWQRKACCHNAYSHITSVKLLLGTLMKFASYGCNKEKFIYGICTTTRAYSEGYLLSRSYAI